MKKEIVHFKVKRDYLGVKEWIVVCDGFLIWGLKATSKRSKVTCKRCQKTRVFRKLKP